MITTDCYSVSIQYLNKDLSEKNKQIKNKMKEARIAKANDMLRFMDALNKPDVAATSSGRPEHAASAATGR